MPRMLALYVTICAVPLLAACGGSGGPAASVPASGGAITLSALDTMKFDPASISVKAGQPVQLTLINKGQVVHDVRIEGPAQPVAVEVKAGDKGTTTFTIDKPGTYAYFCSQAGHRDAGMKGTITVQ